MNKRKRMADLKHRKHQKKLKERRRLQVLTGIPVGVTPEPVEEETVTVEVTPAPKKRIVKKKEPEAAPAPKKVTKAAKVSKAEEKPEPKKRGLKKKESKSEE